MTVSEDLTDFGRVGISQTFDATKQQGDASAVVIRIDDILQPFLRVSQQGQTLTIGLDRDIGFGFGSATPEAGAANLTLNVSGASSVELGDFPASNVQAEVSGARSAEVDASGTLDVEASGASHVTYLGSPTLGYVNVSGASTVNSN